MEEDAGSEKEREEERQMRQKEFISVIDKNNDGVATKEELMVSLSLEDVHSSKLMFTYFEILYIKVSNHEQKSKL